MTFYGERVSTPLKPRKRLLTADSLYLTIIRIIFLMLDRDFIVAAD